MLPAEIVIYCIILAELTTVRQSALNSDVLIQCYIIYYFTRIRKGLKY